MIRVKTNNKKGYDIAMGGDYINFEQPSSTTRRGRVGHGVSQTIDTSANAHCVVVSTEEDRMLRIRKLVPAECFILMGFSKEDADKLSAAGISNTQLYKMAGNSIVVPVLEGIFKEVYKGDH